MQTLVTGGCGFIGSHVVDRLINDGHKVFVVDDLSAECNEKFYYNDKAEYFEYDIGDENFYDNIMYFLDADVDWIFHLAAESRIQPTLENPSLACRTNVVGTCNLLEFARKTNVKRFMYSSTSAGYGLQKLLPLTEDMPRDCLNPYAVTKLAGEDLCVMYHSLFNVPTVSFRYFNVYGERQPLKGRYAPVVGLFMQAYDDELPMSIVGDGLQKRDFVNVQDVVSANLAAAETTNTQALGKVFNVGSGKNYSVLEIAEMVGGPYKHIDPRPGEARNTLADITKIKETLNWEPTIDIEDWIYEHRN